MKKSDIRDTSSVHGQSTVKNSKESIKCDKLTGKLAISIIYVIYMCVEFRFKQRSGAITYT